MSGFIQTVKIKTWTGVEISVDCDDNLSALSLFNAAPEMFAVLENIVNDSSLLSALTLDQEEKIKALIRVVRRG